MMSSVDFTSGTAAAARTRSSQHQVAHNSNSRASGDGRYATMSHHAPSLPLPSSSSSSSPPVTEAGRVKTDQVVIEFLYKVTELVLQSRVHLQADADAGRSTRRARFNLDIEEVPFVREAMAAWKENVHRPLVIDIYWDGVDDESGSGDPRVLVERWSVDYESLHPADEPHHHHHQQQHHVNRRHSSPMHGGPGSGSHHGGGDVIQQLREVCKKIAVLLRALHSFMRLLPAHRVFRQSYPSALTYAIHTGADERRGRDDHLNEGFASEVLTSRYAFTPIHTPFGMLRVHTTYRRDCSALERRRTMSAPIFKENVIIQDYVPVSPELPAATAPGPPPSPPPLSTMSPHSLGARDAPREMSMETRRRSSPSMTTEEPAVSPRRAKHTSQPMAIPQQTKMPAVYDESSSPTDDAAEQTTIQHAHSYGEPERLRSVGTNPNVTPAPYGYGNVTVDRSTPPAPTTSLSGGNGSGLHDLTSSPHPLSTPPRHPNSILTPRTQRSGLSSSVGKRASADFNYRASFENFTLDSSSPNQHPSPSPSPSPSPQLGPGGRTGAFNFGRRRPGSFEDVSGSNGNPLVGDRTSTSPHLTPPFMAESPPQGLGIGADDDSSAALVVRRPQRHDGPGSSPPIGIPVFASSPPFQANPSELLSTSPGYSYGKHYHQYRRAATFASTDSKPVGRSSSFRLTASPSQGDSITFGTTPTKASHSDRSRTFSTDVYENGVGIWGVSPDTPDAFGFAVAGSTRRRVLSHGDGTGEPVGDTTTETSAQEDDDDEGDMMLPFALSVSGSTSTTTTATVTCSDDERSVSPCIEGDTRTQGAGLWDTASVGSFLQQLKTAPRLDMFAPATRTHRSPALQPAPNDVTQAGRARSLLFDDELESFRNLRDQIAQEL